MNISVDIIITISSVIGAILTIITCITKIYKMARQIEDKLEKYDENIEQLNLHLNKMALLDTNLPLVDRIHAGEWYIAHGGNGIGKKVYNQLLNELDTSVWDNSAWHDAQSVRKDKETKTDKEM